MITLKEAFEVEDMKSQGHLTIDQFKRVIKELDISLTKKQVEYLIYEMYKTSKNSKKLKYNEIFVALGLDEYANAFSSNKKVEEVKNDIDEKKSGKKENLNSESEQQQIEATNENVFNDTDVQISDRKVNKKAAAKLSEDSKMTENDAHSTQNLETTNQAETNNNFDSELADTKRENNEGEDDDYIDDEEMIRIAESCLIRISEELKKQNIEIKQLFEENIMVENIGDQTIELLAPIHFIEGLKKLGINDFSELEIA